MSEAEMLEQRTLRGLAGMELMPVFISGRFLLSEAGEISMAAWAGVMGADIVGDGRYIGGVARQGLL
jgi:hypothetical protein